MAIRVKNPNCTPKQTSAARCSRPTSWAGPERFERWQKQSPGPPTWYLKPPIEHTIIGSMSKPKPFGLYSSEVFLKDLRISQPHGSAISLGPGG